MQDIDQAVAQIRSIRLQVARVSQFRGYGPASSAFSGVLGLLVAAVQARWLAQGSISTYVGVWVSTACVAVTLAGIETFWRARRVHTGLASVMVKAAVEQFLPSMVAGSLLAIVVMRAAPQSGWMLPGLWEVIFSLGVFASCRFLPRQMFAVGAWYLAAGLFCLALHNPAEALSPWAMGIPFGVGQLLAAAVLQFGFEDTLEEA
jgi:hypothetical protein